MSKEKADRDRASRKSIFQMPLVQSMVGRTSSITNAFVNTIIPQIHPTLEEVRQAIAILGMDEDDVRCAYCGDPKSEWDHLRPLVVKQRPTGYVSEIANLVPACGKCNQSKGNKDWRTWMLSSAARSPTNRGVSDIPLKIKRLEAYTKWMTPRQIDFESILGTESWSAYWLLWQRVIGELQDSQKVADELRGRIRARLETVADSENHTR